MVSNQVCMLFQSREIQTSGSTFLQDLAMAPVSPLCRHCVESTKVRHIDVGSRNSILCESLCERQRWRWIGSSSLRGLARLASEAPGAAHPLCTRDEISQGHDATEEVQLLQILQDMFEKHEKNVEKHRTDSNSIKWFWAISNEQQSMRIVRKTITSRKIRLLNSSTGIRSQTLFDYIDLL